MTRLIKVAVGRCPITGAPLQLKKDGGLRPHHPLYRRAAAATEHQVHLTYGVGVEAVTRALGVPAEVSKSAMASASPCRRTLQSKLLAFLQRPRDIADAVDEDLHPPD